MVTPTCSAHQLAPALVWGPGAAAGNIGVPFLIVNTSRTSCAPEGYPTVTFSPSSYKGKTVVAVHGGGMMYAAVKARRVVLQPDGIASFGLNYIDAANQQDPTGAACTALYAYVTLPVRRDVSDQNFQTTTNFDYCFSALEITTTALQPRPLPKE